jgi:hypothetical protein
MTLRLGHKSGHGPGPRLAVGPQCPKRGLQRRFAGRWVYLYRAIDHFGQVIDVLVSHGGTGGLLPRA